jgi:phosphate starvation-inducible protein PhoH and related proteins
MARKSGQKPQRSNRAPAPWIEARNNQIAQMEFAHAAPKQKIDRTPIQAKTENQSRYMSAIKTSTITFATGPAGTGKTYLCTALAAEMLDSGEIEQIIITRPAVEAGENLGFLPGELDEKFDPYLQPFIDVLNQRLGKSNVQYMLKSEKILAVPLAYMRGRTFRNAFVILDEAQNTTPSQMKMFLTRIGENTRVVVNGDIRQMDIKGESGLKDAVNRVSWIPNVRHIDFKASDCVRSDIVGDIIKSYDREPISAII